MKKAFTLLELMTVVALMAMLGIASAGGYNALVRGMRERGTVAAATAFLRAAKERARIDRVPTIVFCNNRMLRKANEKTGDSAVVVGQMIAIRRAGRISGLRGKFLFDEFGDLDAAYEHTDNEQLLGKDGGMRLYQFDPSASSMKYSLVAADTFRAKIDPQRGDVNGNAERVFTFAHGDVDMAIPAFYQIKSASASWSVGMPYAFEFSELQLPDGYVFTKGGYPTEVGDVNTVKVFHFDPDSSNNETIEIHSTRPGTSGNVQAHRKAGEATSDEKQGV